MNTSDLYLLYCLLTLSQTETLMLYVLKKKIIITSCLKLGAKGKIKTPNELPLRTRLEKCFDSLVTQHHCNSMASATASSASNLDGVSFLVSYHRSILPLGAKV